MGGAGGDGQFRQHSPPPPGDADSSSWTRGTLARRFLARSRKNFVSSILSGVGRGGGEEARASRVPRPRGGCVESWRKITPSTLDEIKVPRLTKRLQSCASVFVHSGRARASRRVACRSSYVPRLHTHVPRPSFVLHGATAMYASTSKWLAEWPSDKVKKLLPGHFMASLSLSLSLSRSRRSLAILVPLARREGGGWRLGASGIRSFSPPPPPPSASLAPRGTSSAFRAALDTACPVAGAPSRSLRLLRYRIDVVGG